MSEHIIINILDLLENLGENDTKNVLSEFSCPLNPEIEHFLQNNAIEFAKSKKSITYLVFDDEEQERFVGYFTLTHKSSLVPADFLTSSNQRSKLERYAKLDEATNSYDVSAFLLAQFGKSYSVENGKAVSGDSLMDDVFCILKEVQHLIGGGVVFLECEDNQNLLDFYQSKVNRFKRYGERYSETDKKKYLQLLRFF